MTERYHGLDALRGLAMFLGILLHVAISFMQTPLPFWPVWDDQRTPVAEALLFAIHNFRMQLFFLLAGFFGCLLHTRYGWRATVWHRVKRLGVPFVLALLTIQPLLQAISVYAVSSAYRASSEAANGPRVMLHVIAVGDSAAEATVEHFRRGTFLHYIVPAHLWFLWYLLLLFAIVLPLAQFGTRVHATRLGVVWCRSWFWLWTTRGRWLVLPAITWLTTLPMSGPVGPDTPLYWRPDLVLLLYYLVFFVAGWMLYHQRGQLPAIVRSWRWTLAIGQFVVYPLAIGFLLGALEPNRFSSEYAPLCRAASQGAAALYCWCMIVGLIGLFNHYFSAEKAWVRWGADASYWCYLASLPPIVFLQFLVEHWTLPALVKLAGIAISTTAFLLLTYQVGVRYTWIGRILNGPRTRMAQVPTSSVAAVVMES